MASNTDFSDLGRIEALRQLYEGTPYSQSCSGVFPADGNAALASRVFLEGTDFNLVYFPLKHLGYKCVTAITGEIFALLARPVALKVILGVSSKLDFAKIKELWLGIVAAAKEHDYKSVALDLVPSKNGLCISLAAAGETVIAETTAPQSKDLICVSGPLGAAYLGMSALENGLKHYDKSGEQPELDKYKMLIRAYLKPELQPEIPERLKESGIVPSFCTLVSRGLSDSVKQAALKTGLGAKVYADRIPFEGNSFSLGKELDIDPVSAAMNGGDDFRLLITIPITAIDSFRKDFQAWDIIGHLALPDVGTVLVTPDGAELPLRAQGWNDDDE